MGSSLQGCAVAVNYSDVLYCMLGFMTVVFAVFSRCKALLIFTALEGQHLYLQY